MTGRLACLLGCGGLTLLAASAGCRRDAPPAAVERPTRAVVPPATAATAPLGSPPAPAASPARIEPADAVMTPGDTGWQLAVIRGTPTGRQVDLTTQVRWDVEPSGIVRIDDGGYARPITNGRATVRAVREGRTLAQTTVTVDTAGARSWDFAADIVPIFTRYGCNTGGCHGRAEGRNGFHLSLFGYDPEGDFRGLTHDAGGRRVSTMDPEASLVLLKAAGRVPHGGGVRLPARSDAYATLHAWLQAGAPWRSGEPRGEVKAVQVEPSSIQREEPGSLPLRVVVEYRDGHRRDVTHLATYRTNDDSTATVDERGTATLVRRGETDLIVRYGSAVVPVRIGAPVNPDLDFDFAALPRSGFIDELLLRRLEAQRVPPSPAASDAEFLRRVSLDLTGQQPLPDEVRGFLADTDPEKRLKKIDELMQRPEFSRFWEIKLGDLLQITSARFPGGAGYYQEWLQTRFRAGTPWDEMVRELLTALGNPNRKGNGAANYALDGPDAQSRAEQTAQRFLGLRLRCARCHDHPFDVWTQDDYYGLAAFFAKTRMGGEPGAMMGRPEITLDPDGAIEHQRTHAPARPRLPHEGPVDIPREEDPRSTLARWMTAPENPYFARAMANWTWAQLFGKGLSDPADDLSAANPPVHPELLDALADHFIQNRFDLRDLVRTIACSNAYAVSSATLPGNAADQRLFSHRLPRPLTAHQMADALAQATDVPNVYPNQAARAGLVRAIDVFDPAADSTILDTFGRCKRMTGCSVVGTPSLSLRQSLMLIGGDLVDGKVSSLNGYLSRMLEYGVEPGDVVENLYLRALCRFPTAEERSEWTSELTAADDLREAAEDLFWALLNSREFAFNH